MHRLTDSQLGHLRALAVAWQHRVPVRVSARRAGLPPCGATASVLGFSPVGGRWLVAALLHESGALRVLDLESLASARSTTCGRTLPPPPSFDELSFSAGSYLGWGTRPHRRYSFRPSRDAARWLGALLPTSRPGRDASGRPVVNVDAAAEQALLAIASSLGVPVAVDSDPPMPNDTGAVRCLRLAQWLLTQDEPASRDRIYAAFPDEYRGSAAAKEKKFGRDKLLLKRLGFALETVQFGKDEDAVGYLLDARASTLPPVELTVAEASLLWTAGSAALRLSDHPLRDDLESALRKLAVGAKAPPPRAALVEEAPPDDEPSAQRRLLDKLEDAWERRKTVTVDYWRAASGEVVTRKVNVYGWALRRGEWIFVGHCHLRGATRIFYLSRCRGLKMNGVRAQDPDYEIPADFDIRRWSRQQLWDYEVHAPEEAVVRLRGSLARLARQLVPGARVTTEADGTRLARLQVRNLRGLVRQVLAWGPEAEVLSPPRGRELAREMLAQVLAAKEATP